MTIRGAELSARARSPDVLARPRARRPPLEHVRYQLGEGGVGSLFAPWLMGAAIFVNHAPGFDPGAAMDLLERHPVTTLCSRRPPIACSFAAIWRAGHSGTSPPCISAGEAPRSIEVIDLWKQATGLEVHDELWPDRNGAALLQPRRCCAAGRDGPPDPGIDLAVIDHDGACCRRGGRRHRARVGEGYPPGLFLGLSRRSRSHPPACSATAGT